MNGEIIFRPQHFSFCCYQIYCCWFNFSSQHLVDRQQHHHHQRIKSQRHLAFGFTILVNNINLLVQLKVNHISMKVTADGVVVGFIANRIEIKWRRNSWSISFLARSNVFRWFCEISVDEVNDLRRILSNLFVCFSVDIRT